MRNIVLTIMCLFATSNANAQVSIEKSSITNNSTILDFYDEFVGGVAKSLILPQVSDPTGEEGSLVFDTTDQKIKFKNNTLWVDMTPAGNANVEAPATDDIANNSGVIISDGTKSTTDPAVLKLESKEKAMILPRVSDVEKALPNPEAGSIVYDIKSKSIAIFNGSVWSFWN
ncbi:hypothetical protein GO491_04250 [Flavobacteriaceae bacterium Ap0902]|nr:hypothetical protein [Flavobacteriaceae bacterium Ap0902]